MVFLMKTKDVCGSVGTVFVKFLFSSMFVGRFSCLANNFQVNAGAVGSSLSPSSAEVRGKINFPNMFGNTIFTSIFTV